MPCTAPRDQAATRINILSEHTVLAVLGRTGGGTSIARLPAPRKRPQTTEDEVAAGLDAPILEVGEGLEGVKSPLSMAHHVPGYIYTSPGIDTLTAAFGTIGS